MGYKHAGKNAVSINGLHHPICGLSKCFSFSIFLLSVLNVSFSSFLSLKYFYYGKSREIKGLKSYLSFMVL